MQKTLQPNNIKPKIIVAAILAAYAMPQMAMAENRAEAIELGKIEVVGTTPLSSLGVPINQVPSNVQVVKGKDIQNQQSLGLADFMNQNMSGVNINEAQNNPYQPDVNFRGFTASPLLGTPQGLSVYQDGVRINEPFGDTVNWDLIPQNAISSITLMPGSNPLFGLNTLGGALSVQTKSGEHYPGGGVQVYGGSFGRWAVEGEYGGKLDNGFSYFFAGNRFEENGWRDASPSKVLQGFGKLGWSDDKTDVDVSFSGADTDLTGNGFQAQSMLKTFGYNSIYTKPDNTQNKLGFINGKVSHWLSDELLVATNAYYRSNKTKTLNGDGNDEYETLFEICDDNGFGGVSGCDNLYDQGVVNRSETTNKGYGGTLQLTWATERHQLTGGASVDIARTKFKQTEQEAELFDSQRGLIDLDNDIETANDINGRSKTWSLFATDTFSVTPKLALTASGRYNYTRINATDNLLGTKTGTCMLSDGSTTDCATAAGVDVVGDPLVGGGGEIVTALAGGDAGGKHTFKRFNPAVGLTYSFTPELNTYLGYNEGNRAPSPIETACADPLFPCLLPNAMAGDPPLKQVVAKTFEGGFRGKLGKDIGWSMGAYRATNYDDLQFIASSSTGAGYFNNVGKTRRQGLDFGVNGITGDFKWSAGYSYVNATYETGFDIASEANSSRFVDANGNKVISVSKGDKLTGIPEHQLKLRGEWQALPNWAIGASMVAFSDQYARGNENNKHKAVDAANSFDGNDYAGSGKVAGYAVFNLDTRYKFGNTGWQLFGKLNNVFDHKYYSSGLLGENAFVGAGGTFATDAESQKELFLAPGAPRAGWIGVRYDFNKPKVSAASVDVD
ncbi:MAG: TonB-dependent receptor [Methylotenera sp.]|uniref:TonB-dependent receptor n=1 Tax=Methylotenera sp. TaxID=2051956 RepID=UPI002721053C|nr:TonB-dependent receptor [Methylotenera sp.]MDO9392796.1 TonB-dependent receptor [Methylotenera sp.]MDP2070073.1 TonB-dependent receptor [Methylotenera sp.]